MNLNQNYKLLLFDVLVSLILMQVYDLHDYYRRYCALK
jgi:hypothetical protein